MKPIAVCLEDLLFHIDVIKYQLALGPFVYNAICTVYFCNSCHAFRYNCTLALFCVSFDLGVMGQFFYLLLLISKIERFKIIYRHVAYLMRAEDSSITKKICLSKFD